MIIKASAASIQVTDLLFAFAFCKNKPGKLWSSLVCCLLSVNLDYLINLASFLDVQYNNNTTELQSVFVFHLFIGQGSRKLNLV